MTTALASPRLRSLTSYHAAALVGGLVWLTVVLVRQPSPFDVEWAKALLLLVPLVLMPVGLRLLDEDAAGRTPDWSWRLARTLQLPAAVLLGWSFLLPQGLPAAGLALPWVAVTALVATHGLARLWRHRRGPLHEQCVDAGLIFLMIGGVWAVLDRGGLQPLGFDPVIVLLTAIHFHYAGFLLPLLTGMAGRHMTGIASGLAAGGVVLAVPLTAAGITATQLQFTPVLECLAACSLATAGALTAWLYFRLALSSPASPVARVLWLASATCLTAGMVFAAAYGLRFYFPIPWLEIPWMRAVHGTANALGFSLPALLGWTLAADGPTFLCCPAMEPRNSCARPLSAGHSRSRTPPRQEDL